MVIYPQTAFRVSMFAAREMLRDLKASGIQEAWRDRMQTRQELYELLDYDPAADRWTG
jgi:methylisocitrate lyase